MVQLDEEQRMALIGWATPIEAVVALWLFGSRSRNEGRPDSDYDIAIELMPPTSEDEDHAFSAYLFNYDDWKSQIRNALRASVSLIAYRAEWIDAPFDPRVWEIWRRS